MAIEGGSGSGSGSGSGTGGRPIGDSLPPPFDWINRALETWSTVFFRSSQAVQSVYLDMQSGQYSAGSAFRDWSRLGNLWWDSASELLGSAYVGDSGSVPTVLFVVGAEAEGAGPQRVYVRAALDPDAELAATPLSADGSVLPAELLSLERDPVNSHCIHVGLQGLTADVKRGDPAEPTHYVAALYAQKASAGGRIPLALVHVVIPGTGAAAATKSAKRRSPGR